MVTFKGTVENKQIAVKNIFLSNDDAKYYTGISTVNSNMPVNRQGIFDLLGRRVASPTKPGLYIINGKKVNIK